MFLEAYICLQGNLIKSYHSPALANEAISDAVFCDTMTSDAVYISIDPSYLMKLIS